MELGSDVAAAVKEGHVEYPDVGQEEVRFRGCGRADMGCEGTKIA